MISYDFAPYDRNDLAQIITRLAAEDGATVEKSAAELLADFSGGSPGNAKVLLKRLRGYISSDPKCIGIDAARGALSRLGTSISQPAPWT